MNNLQFDTYGQVQQNKDAPVVRFFNDAIEDKAASEREGRPIFHDIEMVEIRFPADKQRTTKRPAKAEWKKIGGRKITYIDRFPEQYRQFTADRPQTVQGTPLTEAPFLTMAQRAMLKGLHVYTIEHLAALDSQPLKNIGAGGRAMQQAAQHYLDQAKGTADVTRLAAENARLKETIEQMQASPQPASGEMSDAEIKDLIKERTGAMPRGNPSRETLKRMLDETA